MTIALFDEARKKAGAFLDSGSISATRLDSPAPDGACDVWAVQAALSVAGVSEFQISLPVAFPAEAPSVFILGEAAHGLPHMEEHGRVCLRVELLGCDYERPHEAVERTLAALEDFLRKCEDPEWVAKEFAREAVLYWRRFCKVERHKALSSNPVGALSVLDEFGGAGSAVVDALVTTRKKGMPHAYVGKGELDARLARHGIAPGTIQRAAAMHVQMRHSSLWASGKCPRTYEQVKNLAIEHFPDAARFFESCVGRGAVKDTTKWKLVVFETAQGLFAYQIVRAALPLLQLPTVVPLEVKRMDVAWCLTRGDSPKRFARRQTQRAVIFGAGSLGAPTAELLARAGIGHLDIVDYERLEEENVSRHPLGLDAVGRRKALALAERIRRQVPGIEVTGHPMRAERWLAETSGLDKVDVIVDLTGSSSVRALLSRLVKSEDVKRPVVIGWMEPFGSAAHVVTLAAGERWPDDDPVGAINFADWPSEAEVQLPGCGHGFHPYGYADAVRAAALVEQKVLDVLENHKPQSCVSTFVRDEEFYDNLPVVAKQNKRSGMVLASRGSYFERTLAVCIGEADGATAPGATGS